MSKIKKKGKIAEKTAKCPCTLPDTLLTNINKYAIINIIFFIVTFRQKSNFFSKKGGIDMKGMLIVTGIVIGFFFCMLILLHILGSKEFDEFNHDEHGAEEKNDSR